MSRGSTVAALTLGCVALLAYGCSESQPSSPVAPGTPAGTADKKPGEPGSASDRMLFQVRLGAVGENSHSAGVMSLEIVGGYLTATVHAAGLQPNVHVPQHIHVNPTCNPGGGILISLDEKLSVAGENPGTGPLFPLSNRAGVVNYRASRSLSDLLNAVNTYSGAGLQSTDELIAWLRLDERNGHMHEFQSPFLPMNCGEVERIN